MITVRGMPTATSWIQTATVLAMPVTKLLGVVGVVSLYVRSHVEDVVVRRLSKKIKNINRVISKLMKGRVINLALLF